MKSTKTAGCLATLAVLLALGTAANVKAQTNRPPAAKPDTNSVVKLVEPAEAQKLIADKKVVVLDVRTAAEYASGHIQGSTNLDIRDPDFQSKLAKLDKTQPYLVHCAVGMRSAKACTAMDKLDFKTVYDLKGGLTAWQKAGLPVEK
jgi:phage shock protein E